MQDSFARHQAKVLMHHYLTFGRPEIDQPDSRAEIDSLVDCLIDAAVNEALEQLDYKCQACDGAGLRTCTGCHGTGYQLTEKGAALLRFYRHHIDPDFES